MRCREGSTTRTPGRNRRGTNRNLGRHTDRHTVHNPSRNTTHRTNRHTSHTGRRSRRSIRRRSRRSIRRRSHSRSRHPRNSLSYSTSDRRPGRRSSNSPQRRPAHHKLTRGALLALSSQFSPFGGPEAHCRTAGYERGIAERRTPGASGRYSFPARLIGRTTVRIEKIVRVPQVSAAGRVLPDYLRCPTTAT